MEKGALALANQIVVGGEIPLASSPRIWVEILEEVTRKESWNY